VESKYGMGGQERWASRLQPSSSAPGLSHEVFIAGLSAIHGSLRYSPPVSDRRPVISSTCGQPASGNGQFWLEQSERRPRVLSNHKFLRPHPTQEVVLHVSPPREARRGPPNPRFPLPLEFVADFISYSRRCNAVVTIQKR
jgi:hypothetical protein